MKRRCVCTVSARVGINTAVCNEQQRKTAFRAGGCRGCAASVYDAAVRRGTRTVFVSAYAHGLIIRIRAALCFTHGGGTNVECVLRRGGEGGRGGRAVERRKERGGTGVVETGRDGGDRWKPVVVGVVATKTRTPRRRSSLNTE